MDQENIHEWAYDEDIDTRKKAANALGKIFSRIPDKNLASNDIIKLTKDRDRYVRASATRSLGIAFPYISNKNMAWQRLIRLAKDNDNYVRSSAAESLGMALPHFTDPNVAWRDIIDLTQNENDEVRWIAARILGPAFSFVSDKERTWQDLHTLVQDVDKYVRGEAAEALGMAYAYVEDKKSAWQDLHKLTEEQDNYVRWGVARTLGLAFPHIPNKNLAWEDLHRLSDDRDSNVRWGVARSFGSAFQYIPDKLAAWQDLHRLSKDRETNVRLGATESIGLIFPLIEDRIQASDDLQRLSEDKEAYIRLGAARAIGSIYQYIPNKMDAWRYLIRLSQDRARNVRGGATLAIGQVFPFVNDRDLASKELFKLSRNGDSYVRGNAAEAIGLSISYINNKSLALDELERLAKDGDSNVRVFAYHSLGRASVFKATEAKDKTSLIKELESAVLYFEKSLMEETTFNPASFCYPFYRSYLAITFQEPSELEVQNYLVEAKAAVGSSRSKDDLFKAVENLAKALLESQHLRIESDKLKGRPLDEIEQELNAYRWYCEKAAGHMDAAEDDAPGAVKLIRKGLPFIDEKIKATIAQIKKQAEKINRVTSSLGEEYRTFGVEINTAANYLTTDDIFRAQRCSSRIISRLESICRILPEEKKMPVEYATKEIKGCYEFPEMLEKIEVALRYVNVALMHLVDVVILTVLPEEYEAIRLQLPSMSNSSDMNSAQNLYAWQFGNVPCQKFRGFYKVALGMIGRAGTNQSALAASEAIRKWNPRYIFFVGIAGGLSDLRKGDVIIADVIHGYEYGKIEKSFQPRDNWNYKTHIGLLNLANAYSLNHDWHERIKRNPPSEANPNVVCGEIASGDKVVDNPKEAFFIEILKKWPKIKAVEMEGAGVGNAIEQAVYAGAPVGFMMIRGVSDLPRVRRNRGSKGTDERDKWKTFAAEVAAAFAIGLIANALPEPPIALDEHIIDETAILA